MPVIERLPAEGLLVSVDTWRPPVARATLAAGAVMVNDVSGIADRRLAEACARAGARDRQSLLGTMKTGASIAEPRRLRWTNCERHRGGQLASAMRD